MLRSAPYLLNPAMDHEGLPYSYDAHTTDGTVVEYPHTTLEPTRTHPTRTCGGITGPGERERGKKRRWGACASASSASLVLEGATAVVEGDEVDACHSHEVRSSTF